MNENQTDRQDLSEIQASDAAVQSDAKPIRWWQESDDKYLRANWGRRRASVIGKALDRTRNAVIARAHRLGLLAVGPLKVKKAKPKPKPRKVIAKSVVKPVEPIEPKQPDTPAEPVSIFDLRLFDCRWPLGDPQIPGFGFCGAAANRAYGYCRIHRASAKVARS